MAQCPMCGIDEDTIAIHDGLDAVAVLPRTVPTRSSRGCPMRSCASARRRTCGRFSSIWSTLGRCSKLSAWDSPLVLEQPGIAFPAIDVDESAARSPGVGHGPRPRPGWHRPCGRGAPGRVRRRHQRGVDSAVHDRDPGPTMRGGTCATRSTKVRITCVTSNVSAPSCRSTTRPWLTRAASSGGFRARSLDPAEGAAGRARSSKRDLELGRGRGPHRRSRETGRRGRRLAARAMPSRTASAWRRRSVSADRRARCSPLRP